MDYPIKFRVRPEKSLYFVVQIWPTKKAMHDYHKIDRHGHRRLGKHCVGCFCGTERYRFEKGKPQYKSPFMGDIHLIEGRLHYDTVCHEILHAAFHWAHRAKGMLDVVADPEASHVTEEEERFCYGYTKMFEQLTRKLHKLGYWHTVSTDKRSRLAK